MWRHRGLVLLRVAGRTERLKKTSLHTRVLHVTKSHESIHLGNGIHLYLCGNDQNEYIYGTEMC